MRKLLCGIALTLSLAGCTSVTNGAAMAPLGKCTEKGFEDLPAASMDCGDVYETEFIVSGVTPRLVEEGDDKLLYIIRDTELDHNVLLPPRSDEIAIRSYEFKLVVVERMNNADVVQILVSDNCPVESLYEPSGPLCTSTGPLLGQQVNTEEAAIMVGRPLVDRMEQIATDGNRFTVYTVGTASA